MVHQKMKSNRADAMERTDDDADTDMELHPRHANSSRNTSSSIPPPSEWLNRYNQLLDRYPLQTKMCTSFLVSAFGSALGSYLSASATNNRDKICARDDHAMNCTSKRESALTKINWVDVFSYAIHGALINTPICHYWYEWMSVHGPKSNTASVLVDQLVVQPPLLACKCRYHIVRQPI